MAIEDNPIGALQELSQARNGGPAPVYVLVSVSGESHCPHFVYSAAWGDLTTQGEGSSKVSSYLHEGKYNINSRKKPKSLLLRNC